MADDTEKTPIRMRKTIHLASRHPSTSDGNGPTLERKWKNRKGLVARPAEIRTGPEVEEWARQLAARSAEERERERRNQQELATRKAELRMRMEAEERMRMEAEERARQEVLLAGRSAEERDMDALSDRFDQVVERYLRQFGAAIPGFSLAPLIMPPGSRAKGYKFSFDGKTGWVQHNRKAAWIERVSPGRRGMDRTLVARWMVDDLTTRNVGKAIKEVLGIRRRRGAPDREE